MGLGAATCAVLHFVLDWLPVVGEIAAGIVAGVLAGGGSRRGLAAGLLGGAVGGLALAALLYVARIAPPSVLVPSTFTPESVVLFALKDAALSGVGGIVGAALTAEGQRVP